MIIDFFTNQTSLPLAYTCNHCILWNRELFRKHAEDPHLGDERDGEEMSAHTDYEEATEATSTRA